MGYQTIEDAKRAHPVDSKMIQNGIEITVTGYYFDRSLWWPVNIVENNFIEIPKNITIDLRK